MIHFGIDVGVSGAASCIDGDANLIGCEDLVTTRIGKIAWTDPCDLIRFINECREGRQARAWVEYVAPMPSLSTIAAAGMGRTHGSVLAALQMAGIPFEMIAPAQWKRKLNVLRTPGMSDRDAKEITRGRAQVLFPTAELDRKKDHNRAESLLIAYFGRGQWVGPAAMQAGANPF